jgi:hypothetical protein
MGKEKRGKRGVIEGVVLTKVYSHLGCIKKPL